MTNKTKQFYAYLNIRFFDNKDSYISEFLNGVNTSRRLTVLLYIVSQCYYQYKNDKTLILCLDKKLNSKTSFLKNLKLSNVDVIREIERIRKTKYIDKVKVNDKYIEINFEPDLFFIDDKKKRFTICLNDLLSFKYIEHSIVYLLTRYGKSQGYLYHNYLCKVLHLHHLPFSRQKQRLKRIFALLKKRGFITSYRYENYTYFYNRGVEIEVFF